MESKCQICGAPMEGGKCSYCGYVEKKDENPYMQQTASPQPQVVIQNQVIQQNVNQGGIVHGISQKKKMVALLLCIFLGYFGIHRFYVGKVGSGVLYCFTGGVCGIGWLIDIFMILCGSFKDEFGLPLKS